jgi:hypothetical protein
VLPRASLGLSDGLGDQPEIMTRHCVLKGRHVELPLSRKTGLVKLDQLSSALRTLVSIDFSTMKSSLYRFDGIIVDSLLRGGDPLFLIESRG